MARTLPPRRRRPGGRLHRQQEEARLKAAPRICYACGSTNVALALCTCHGDPWLVCGDCKAALVRLIDAI